MALLNQTQQDYYNGDNYGDYQFVSLNDIIEQFMIVYVGEEKIIPKASRIDVAFHAQRALAELSFDTFKSCKSQEVTIPPSLQMNLPQDYVNYTKISWVDSAGVKHPIYPTGKTSNPTPILQNDDGEYKLTAIGTTTNLSNVVVLDGEYKQIQVGMIANNPTFSPETALVQSVSNDNNITTITLGIKDSASTIPGLLPFNSTFNTGNKFTFNFYKQDESLLLEKTSFVLENITWSAFDEVLVQSPNTDVSNIEVGMSVSHTAFPVGTVVTDVTDNNIFVSNPAIVASTSTTNEVTFVSKTNDSTTWANYQTNVPSENIDNDYDVDDDIYDLNIGQRYGMDPQHSQVNGSYYIDCNAGKIHFSSNIAGKTVVLDYISDSLGTPEEMKVHKFAEEAMYKWITHAVLASKFNTPEYLVNRFKKERFAAIRNAKLRLSNIKLEEIVQTLRGKSKQIKH
tara:strand:+ start:1669 stop:3030 length:1362 start_codon:yes stop_codon:yes gene_type:complete